MGAEMTDRSRNMADLLHIFDKLGFDALPEVLISNLESDKENLLKAIRNDIGNCKRCKLHTGRTNIVFGEGDPNTRLMFVGEGPGADEDATGRPFVGRAGKVLESLINKMGFRREDVYIANIVKCRPPGNREPEEDEIAACRGFIERQIESIAPDAIMTLGNVSTKTLLSTDKTIGQMRGDFYDYNGIKVMPTYHPSYFLRNPSKKVFTWNDAIKVLNYLGIEVISIKRKD
ncbi:uracil-DNA glycosylase [Candidatus Magnetominusculus dajiuhuensis]|uniref:uracil-DNA glycosylase n=1 Tax=Candidatus Magnetominusculus dajiuhuensis TaxID=3137712 RepID=UPI003B437C59